ncbi:MAG: ABC transporter ATP-binding protein [Thermoplasmata archaeon]|jgi:iron complex transport system ATP-binding protein|nr:MAG: ABC transporter [Aciduliprofundum sp.]
MILISVRDIEFSYGSKKIIDGISFDLMPGEILGFLGPNGSGKTTLIKLVGGILKKERGTIRIKGRDIEKYSRRELARIVSIVPSDLEPGFDFTVQDLVAMGRYPYIGFFDSFTQRDYEIIRRSMEATGVSHLSMNSVREISGGEKQRMLIARALAQDTEILLMDEPTSNLDIKYQVEILELIEGIRRTGRAIMITMHDVNMAIRYCTRLALISKGKIYSIGPPDNVINENSINMVYGINGKIIRNGDGKIVYIIPEKIQ